MAKPIWFYNVKLNRWELKNKSSQWEFTVDDNSVAQLRKVALTTSGTVPNLSVPSQVVIGDGTAIKKIWSVVGTNSAGVAVGTGSSALGSIAVTGVRLGDFVSGNPKAAFPANIGIGGFYVSGSNNVNILVTNSDYLTQGSLPATGFDMLVMDVT